MFIQSVHTQNPFLSFIPSKKKVLDERAPDFETSVSLCPVTLDVLNLQPQPDVNSKTGIG